jgi:Putative MetA-pathway of phenol degradation
MNRSILVFVGLASLLVPATAAATPQPLPFTYVYETLPKGSLEVEQYVDYTPLRLLNSSGTPTTYGASQFQTEFEYGISDRLELGLYATIAPNTPAYENVPPLTEGTGLKERLRLRLAEAGEWPLDVGLYGELVENEREFEIEAKIILQRRIGDLRLVANLWAEREYENFDTHQGDWVINPTVGATYQVTPGFHPGIEGWMRAEFQDHPTSPRPFNLGPVVYVGPAMMFDFGNFWWSVGAYFRVSDAGRPLDTGANGTAPDAFGHLWFRMIIGLAF